MRFKDKVVVVTASGSGVGLAAVKLFAAEGAIVAINDISGDGRLKLRKINLTANDGEMP